MGAMAVAARNAKLDVAVRLAALQWFGSDWLPSLRRVEKRGLWGLRKSLMFCDLVRGEFQRLEPR